MANKNGHIHHALSWVAFLSVFSHIFCCGLPLVLGVVSLLTGFGMISVAFPLLDNIHERMSGIEMPLMVFSAIVLVVGWGAQIHAARIDCHDTGCVHEPCGGTKKRTTRLLFLATIVFAFNLVAFTVSNLHGHF